MFSVKNIVLFFVVVLSSCSTTKNNFFSRNYHNTTSRYNTLFNARQNIRSCEEDIENNFVENYKEVLSFYKTSENSTKYNNKLDRAIKKAKKNITQHSITSKGEEHCKWIDESYVIIAKS